MTSKRLLKALRLCPALLLFAFSAQAQKTIKGKIMDDRGTPIMGASIVIKGVKTGTTSDANGAFSLTVPSGTTSITVSSIGYSSKDVDVSATSDVTVSLTSENSTLNDVVVVGYGTARRRDVTGSVASVTDKDFNKGLVTNPAQQIAGKVSGVVITQPSGDPNQNISIRLRGQTSILGNQQPLIVVDGVPLPDPNMISSIAPSDIVTYDVLKDASATAIYGSRGANGVILISTKKGRSGKAQVDYSGSVGFEKLAKKFDLLNRDEYIKAGGAATNTVGPDITSGNTDWQKAITQTGFNTNHNIGISGGSNGFSYHGSINYLKQDGIVINTSSKELYALNFNAQQKALNNKLTMNLGINVNHVNRTYPDYSVFYYITQMSPLTTPYDSTGALYAYKNDFDVYNPYPLLKLKTTKNAEQTNLWSGSVDYELIPGLKVGTAGSMSFYTNQGNGYTPVLPGYNNSNSGYQSSDNKNLKRGEIHANYVKDFGLHSINATAVYEYNYFENDGFNANAQNFLVDVLQNNNLGTGNPAQNTLGSYKNEFKLISFLGRVMYNYNSRYYLTANFRRDGSSKFGVNNRWANFPGLSVAWRLSQESFMSDISWINELKLSGGWGHTGNSDAIDPYKTLQLLGTQGNYYNPSSSTYPYQPSYGPSQNANPDLKWETRQDVNVQLDFALFQSRLTGNINVFSDKTKDMLYTYTVPVPPFFVNSILANVGDLTNKGVELQLAGDVVRSKDFTWNLGGQISFLKTKVTSLSGTYAGYKLSTDVITLGSAQGRGLSNADMSYLKVGYSPYVFWLAHYVGLDGSGKELFDDGKGGTVGQGGITNDMKRYIDPAPNFTYGINSSLSYKQFALGFFLRGVSGIKVFDNTRLLIDNVGNLSNGNTTQTAIASGDKDIKVVSDKWLESGSFLRLDNATLSYAFKKLPVSLSSLRLFITGNNLFNITKYKGLDPEVQVTDGGNSYIDRYNADNAYYKSRAFSFGVNLSLK